MDEATRSQKRTKFGSLKFVYTPDVMREVRAFFEEAVPRLLPQGRILYWT
jgi:spore photoproduct lyase